MGVGVQVEWMMRTRGVGNDPLLGGVQGQRVVGAIRTVLHPIDKEVIIWVPSGVPVWPCHTERHCRLGRRGGNIRQEGWHGGPRSRKRHWLWSQAGIDTHGEQRVWRRGRGRELP